MIHENCTKKAQLKYINNIIKQGIHVKYMRVGLRKEINLSDVEELVIKSKG